jgi:hypothetical protein
VSLGLLLLLAAGLAAVLALLRAVGARLPDPPRPAPAGGALTRTGRPLPPAAGPDDDWDGLDGWGAPEDGDDPDDRDDRIASWALTDFYFGPGAQQRERWAAERREYVERVHRGEP